MARIAFILLCHRDPAGVIEQAQRLTAAGDAVAIHFDRRSNNRDFAAIQAGLAGNPAVTFAHRRTRCGWGEWSLVRATLDTLKAAEKAFPDATHFYMLSGDCMPIKSAAHARAFLDETDADYIESVDFYTSNWIKTGFQEERLIYRHFFNERSQKWLYYHSLELQNWLKLKRRVPADLQIMIGSQWWCLRRRTVEAVLGFCARRPDVLRFFRLTWIPDETFFQTLVRHLVADAEIRSRTLTFLMFSDYGLPVTFHNDHYDLLQSQDFLFARKISPDATELKVRLGELWLDAERRFEISGEAPGLYRYLSSRGRDGRRHAARAWEAQATLGQSRELLAVMCKKWHVAKRVAEAAGREAGISALEYIFDETLCPLPDLGGIESSVEKRRRHRRSFLRLVCDGLATNRLLICLDTSDSAMLADARADHVNLRVLEIDCTLSDEYLAGHIRRLGLVGHGAGGMAARLLHTVRRDIQHEVDRLRSGADGQYFRLSEGADETANAAAVAGFLRIETERARAITANPLLFAD